MQTIDLKRTCAHCSHEGATLKSSRQVSAEANRHGTMASSVDEGIHEEISLYFCCQGCLTVYALMIQPRF